MVARRVEAKPFGRNRPAALASAAAARLPSLPDDSRIPEPMTDSSDTFDSLPSREPATRAIVSRRGGDDGAADDASAAATRRDAAARDEAKGAAVLGAHGIEKRVSGPEGELVILSHVEMDVVGGEAVAIVGPSGSGKSTLLGLLAGLDTPSAGTITLLGEELGALDEDQRARLRAGRVGFVFQNFQLLPGLSALENVMLPLELAGQGDAAERARAMLADVGLAHRAGHQPLQLSGGEQQRVALARAFVSQPALLFADEPTGNLDSETGARVVDLMFSLRERLGSALVLVTHDETLARRCDRRLRMDGGRLGEAVRDESSGVA